MIDQTFIFYLEYLPELQGISYEISKALNSVQVWSDSRFTFSNLPSYLLGTIFFQMPYQATFLGTVIEILIYKPSILYIAYEDSTSGSYGNSLRAAGWTLITDKGQTSTGCCTLNYVWRRYVLTDGLTTIAMPAMTKNKFVFTLFVETDSSFIPGIQGASYELSTAFNEAVVWVDRSFRFSNLPIYLTGSIFFQFGYKLITQGTLIDILLSKKSIIYIAYEGSRSGRFGRSLQQDNWSLVTDEGDINTGCCTLTYIWKYEVSFDGVATITLPEIPIRDFVFIIFIQGNKLTASTIRTYF